MLEFYFVRLYLYKHPVLGRATPPTPLMTCGAPGRLGVFEQIHIFFIPCNMPSNYRYIPPEQKQLLVTMHIRGAICCSLNRLSLRLRRMGKVISIKVIIHVCWRAHRHGCFIATKSPPIARVDNVRVVYFDDIFVVAGGH